MEPAHMIDSFIRALMLFTAVLGNNWLAVACIPRQKSGLRTNEILLINLAISNLITNFLVDLPETIADFAGRWFFGRLFCGVSRFCADLAETSSIYTTVYISTFWHQKLVGSLKRGVGQVQMDSLRLVAGLLMGSWTLALAFGVPHFVFMPTSEKNESIENCEDIFPNPVVQNIYEIIFLTVANALPVIGIVYASFQIVVSLLRNQKRIESHFSEGVKEKSNNVVSDSGSANNIKNTSSGDLHSSNAEPRTQSDLSKFSQTQSKLKVSSGIQVRAAKSVLAVATVVLLCWVTHLLLRIGNNIHTSGIAMELASYLGASYTCIIPYIFLHGVRRLSCSCKR